MAFIIKSNPPRECTIDKVLGFLQDNYPRYLPLIVMHKTAGEKYGVNWLLLNCWGVIRSDFGTSKACKENLDIFGLGGRYATFRDAVAKGAYEFSKYETTAAIPEQSELEKMYEKCIMYCKSLPEAEIPPPPPDEIPKPIPAPNPKPPEKKPSFGWAKVLLPVLVLIATAGTFFLPGWAKVVLDVIIKMLESF